MCTLLLRGGELQSTLGFVKEAQIQPDPEEEPRGLGWQLVPVLGPHLVLAYSRRSLSPDFGRSEVSQIPERLVNFKVKFH